MLAKIARQLGDSLARALELPQEAADRAAYALEILFLYILTLAAIAIPAYLLGLFWPAMAATLTAGAMRSVSGGAHLNSPWRCIVLSSLIAITLGMTSQILDTNVSPFFSAFIAWGTLVLGSIVLFKYSPVDTQAKPIPSNKLIIFKYLSLSVLFLWVIALLFLPLRMNLRWASMLGMIWQITSLTPIGHHVFYSIDKFGQKEVTTNA